MTLSMKRKCVLLLASVSLITIGGCKSVQNPVQIDSAWQANLGKSFLTPTKPHPMDVHEEMKKVAAEIGKKKLCLIHKKRVPNTKIAKRWVMGIASGKKGEIIAILPKAQRVDPTNPNSDGQLDPKDSLEDWKKNVLNDKYFGNLKAGWTKALTGTAYPSPLDFNIGHGDLIAIRLIPDSWYFDNDKFVIHGAKDEMIPPFIIHTESPPLSGSVDRNKVIFVQMLEPELGPGQSAPGLQNRISKRHGIPIPYKISGCIYKYDIPVVSRIIDNNVTVSETLFTIDPLVGNGGGPPGDGGGG